MHAPRAQVQTVPATDAKPRPDQDEAGVAIAERDERVGQSGAALHVAVLAHQVLAIRRDRSRPATPTVDGQLEHFAGDVAHPGDSRTPVLSSQPFLPERSGRPRPRRRADDSRRGWGGLRVSNP